MKQSRSIAFILLIIALAVTAAVSGYIAVAPEKDNPQREITVVLPNASEERWNSFRTGIRAAAREYGISLTIISTTEDNEADQIASALEEKPDGIIVSLLSDQTASVLDHSSVPTVLLGTRGSLETSARLSQISLSAKAAGVSLAQLLLSYRSSASDLKIGILCSANSSSELTERLASLNEELAKHEISPVWILRDTSQVSLIHAQAETPADLIIALDNDSLEAAAEYREAHPDQIFGLYGIGISTTCISYTDSEVIDKMIVPNEYLAGFTAIEQISDYCSSRTSMENTAIDYSIITRANMFTKKNQQLLFPISQ